MKHNFLPYIKDAPQYNECNYLIISTLTVKVPGVNIKSGIMQVTCISQKKRLTSSPELTAKVRTDTPSYYTILLLVAICIMNINQMISSNKVSVVK